MTNRSVPVITLNTRHTFGQQHRQDQAPLAYPRRLISVAGLRLHHMEPRSPPSAGAVLRCLPTDGLYNPQPGSSPGGEQRQPLLNPDLRWQRSAVAPPQCPPRSRAILIIISEISPVIWTEVMSADTTPLITPGA